MKDIDLFQLALGLTLPWEVIDASFGPEVGRLDIELDFERGGKFECACGRGGCSAHDTDRKTWRHLNFFQHSAYINARFPRIKCPDCGVVLAPAPWARRDSGSTRLAVEFLTAGGNDFVEKPVDYNVLGPMIQRHALNGEIAASLRRQQEYFSTLMENSPTVIFSAETEEPYPAIFVSPNIKAVTGHAAVAFKSPGFWIDQIHSGDRQRVLAEVPRLFETGVSEHEYRMRYGDGSYHWVYNTLKLILDSEGRPREVVGSLTDVDRLKEKERQLSQSQEALDNAAEAVLFTGVDGRFRYSNEQARKMLGYSESELKGKSVWDLNPEYPRRRFLEEFLPESRKGDPIVTEYLLKTRNGFFIPVEAKSRHIRGKVPEEDFIVAFFMDITRRKEFEKRLESERTFSRLIINSLGSLIVVLDADGAIIDANDAWFQFMREMDPAKEPELGIDYMKHYELHCQADAVSTRRIIDGIFRVLRGDAAFFEAEFPYGKGQALRWLTIRAVPLRDKSRGAVISHNDITQRRVMERRLRESEDIHRFQSKLLENVKDSVVATDMDGHVTYWGKGAEWLYGYGYDEVMGRHVTEFIVSPENVKEEEARIRAVHENGSWSGQYEQRRKDGSIFWADTHVSLAKGADGNPIGVIGIDRDITDRKEAEAAKLARAAAEEMNQMKSEFMASMSHELRTPLSGMIVSAQTVQRLMRKGRLTNEAIGRQMDDIIRLGRHLTAIISDIMEISKIEAGQIDVIIEPVDIAQMLDGLKSTYNEVTNDKNLYFRVKIPDRLPVVWADRQKATQILINLIDNSIKFTEKGGITIDAAETNIDGQPCVRICVTDTGFGIPPDLVERIFDRFERLEKSGKIPGAGLGLAISKKFAELMGGRITCVSRERESSRFCVYLRRWEG